MDHRLVEHRQQLFGNAAGDRPQPGAGAAGQHYAFHGRNSTFGQPVDLGASPALLSTLEGVCVRILVTGAASFIGSNFVRRMLEGTYPAFADAR